jgi:hypothetical protein
MVPLRPEQVEVAPFVQQIEGSTLSSPTLVALLRAVLDRGLPFRFRATGFSMLPFVRDEDVITVAPSAGASPSLGDVVAFLHPDSGKLAVHRVVGKQGSSVLVRGDNVEKPDGLVAIADLLGRVTRVERDGRRVYLGLGPERRLIAFLTRWGLFLSMVLPAWRLVRPIVRRRSGRRSDP